LKKIYEKKVLTRESPPGIAILVPNSYRELLPTNSQNSESGHTPNETGIYEPALSKKQLSELVSTESRYSGRWTK
jgi:hypothetical protein